VTLDGLVVGDAEIVDADVIGVPRGLLIGTRFKASNWDLVTLRDGKIVREQWFDDRADALAAAGGAPKTSAAIALAKLDRHYRLVLRGTAADLAHRLTIRFRIGPTNTATSTPPPRRAPFVTATSSPTSISPTAPAERAKGR
jgi:hypothetical protein